MSDSAQTPAAAAPAPAGSGLPAAPPAATPTATPAGQAPDDGLQAQIKELRAENAARRVAANEALAKLAAHEKQQAQQAEEEAKKRGEFEKLYQDSAAKSLALQAENAQLKHAAEQLRVIQEGEAAALTGTLPPASVAALGLTAETPLGTKLALLRAAQAGIAAAAAQVVPAAAAPPAGRTGAQVSGSAADTQQQIERIFADTRLTAAQKSKAIDELQRKAYS